MSISISIVIIGLITLLLGSINAWYGAIIGSIGLPILVSQNNVLTDLQVLILISVGFLFGKIIGSIGSALTSD